MPKCGSEHQSYGFKPLWGEMARKAYPIVTALNANENDDFESQCESDGDSEYLKMAKEGGLERQCEKVVALNAYSGEWL